MGTTLRAVLFDMGGTLEDLYYTEATRAEATQGLQALLAERGLDPRLPLPDLQTTVLAGMKAYTRWREKSEQELPPERVWSEFIFSGAGLPRKRLAQAAEELMFYHETHWHVRMLRPEARATIEALAGLGMRMAVISNIVSRTIVPILLEKYELSRYFNPVLTSSNFGWRKPNERIFLEASGLMGMLPAECAYVGDTVSRDVTGARRAGYGLAIQIKSFLTDKSDKETDTEQPDAVIQSLMDVVGLVTKG